MLEHAKDFSEGALQFGVMTCSSETRRSRLKQRGTKQIAKYSPEQSKRILEKMHNHGVKEFNTEKSAPKEVAQMVRAWLESI